MNPDLPNVDATLFEQADLERLVPAQRSTHAPRILLLYGSVRERSYSRLLTEEAARLLRALGAETRIFDPRGLPLPDAEPDSHPKVVELRELAQWAEGMVWTRPIRGPRIMASKIEKCWRRLTSAKATLAATPP